MDAFYEKYDVINHNPSNVLAELEYDKKKTFSFSSAEVIVYILL